MTPEELRELAAAHERFDTDDYREGDAAKVLWLAGKRQQRAVLAALADAWETLGAASAWLGELRELWERGVVTDTGPGGTYSNRNVGEDVALRAALVRLATLGEEKP